MLPNITQIDDICLGSSTVVGTRLRFATVVSDFRGCPLTHGVICEVLKVEITIGVRESRIGVLTIIRTSCTMLFGLYKN